MSRAAAVREIRRAQEAAWRKVAPEGREATETSSIEAALAKAEQRERDGQVEGDMVRDFAFRYPLVTERLRWSRTRDIIERVAPGPYEDGVYLEFLARQAASVEVVLRQEHTEEPNAKMHALCDRIVLATMPSLAPSASTGLVRGYSTVYLSSGLVEFMYQAAKFVVLSWDVQWADTGGVRVESDTEAMDRMLAERPDIPGRLLKTYLGYLFDGVPRRETASPPPSEFQLPLQFLMNFNERFVIAHEYAHTLVDAAADNLPEDFSRKEEEMHSDVTAFYLLNESARVLDLVPPVMASQGAFFVLAVLESLRRACDLVRFGEVREDTGFASHPPVMQRYQLLAEVYRDQVAGQDENMTLDKALAPARSLMHLWSRMEAPLAAYSKLGQPLHPVWGFDESH